MPPVEEIIGRGVRRRQVRRAAVGVGAAAMLIAAGAGVRVATDDQPRREPLEVAGSPTTSSDSEAAVGSWAEAAPLPVLLGAPVSAAVTRGEIVVAGSEVDGGRTRLFAMAAGADDWREVDAPGLPALALGAGDGSGSPALAAVDGRLAVLGHDEEGLRVAIGDTTARPWDDVPRPPTEAGASPAFVGNGRHLLVYGGEDDERHPVSTGLVLDVGTGEWTRTSDSPLGARSRAFAQPWGTRIVVVGGGSENREHVDGAIYDPAADSWLAVEPVPGAISVVGLVRAGEEIVAVGSGVDGGLVSATLMPDGTWRALDGPDLEVPRTGLKVTGTAVVGTPSGAVVWFGSAVPEESAGQVLTLPGRTWQPTPDPSPGMCSCLAAGASTETDVLFIGGMDDCGEAVPRPSPQVVRYRR
jgi:hypothetical protein